ncbi:LysR family transcriptional regulator [Rheinheimera texasensis]|uniref:LysR family transcriptional regulator n=1 Tax=Rheinheimera texasensis TaxID=306205 RepID=UPI0004E25CFA|nr:LysR family transcriptional regulator [Rheinheimera texasensis]
MNLQQLETLLTVVETGSFSAAARKLGKAQSAISTAISELEIDLDLHLFDRSGRYPQLTEVGARILQQAKLVHMQCSQLKELAVDLASGTETCLRLAVDDEGQLPWLAPILAELAERFPKLELQIMFPLLEDVTHLLADDEADLGICFQPQSPSELFLRWPLHQLHFVAAASVDHPLSKLVSVTNTDLQQYRQLMVAGRGKGAEKQRGRLSGQVWWLEGDIAVLAMVEQGVGWAWLPEHVLEQNKVHKNIKALPIVDKGATLLPLQLELWQCRNKTVGPAALWLKRRLLTR